MANDKETTEGFPNKTRFTKIRVSIECFRIKRLLKQIIVSVRIEIVSKRIE